MSFLAGKYFHQMDVWRLNRVMDLVCMLKVSMIRENEERA
jgi:hypothetical protein